MPAPIITPAPLLHFLEVVGHLGSGEDAEDPILTHDPHLHGLSRQLACEGKAGQGGRRLGAEKVVYGWPAPMNLYCGRRLY